MNKAKDKKLFIAAMVREYNFLNAEFMTAHCPQFNSALFARDTKQTHGQSNIH